MSKNKNILVAALVLFLSAPVILHAESPVGIWKTSDENNPKIEAHVLK